MYAIELGRRRAAELHDAAVARGLDPTDPYSFAVAVAKDRGLDVDTANPGAAVLANGRATLVPEDNLIVHENVGSPFDQAFLVAHEIGHHELGDAAAPATVIDADPARASEPSPTGIDRVVDYGRRQRREVQMDLFGRELLIPRALVRHLHLEEGLTASMIAKRMNAPFDAVAQQLLDALLLPVIELDERVRVDKPLNTAQADAAAHRGGPYILEAGPGTGKTQTLTARVVQLIDEGVDPRRLLVLTYSNKAAGEMADRIADKRPEQAAAMWIGTFHAFGLDLIRRLGPEFSLPSDPRLIDRVEAVELLEAEFPRLELEHYQDLYDPTRLIGDILAAISRAKDEVVGPEAYALRAEEMRIAAGGDEPRRTNALKAAEVGRIYAAYEQLKRNRKAIDFGDLVSLPVDLLEARPAIAAQLGQLYDHILVDEYQDVNRASVRLLKALRPTGENLWVVGDARQSIYRFRGASPISMSRFASQDFPSAKSGRLEVNYRSVEEVVNAYSALAVQMTAGGDAALRAHRGPSGLPIELRLRASKEEQSVLIADGIDEMLRSGIAYRDQAVLCTGNERLGEIARDLERMGIPVLFLGSLFERGEVKDLLSLLSLLADRRAMGLLRTGCMPGLEMTLGDIGAVLEYLRDEQREPLEWLAARGTLPISTGGRLALDELAAVLEGFDANSPPWGTLATIVLDRTRIAARIGEAASIAERSQGIAIWQLMNFLRVQPGAQGRAVPRLLDRIRRLVAIGDDRDLRQLPTAAQGLDAVRLMTIHGAKGLEFECVHLPGLNQDTLPSPAKAPPCLPPEGIIAGMTGDVKEALRAGDAEERECLFYVATSRARDRLVLYAATQKSDGKNRPLSNFLARLGPDIVRSTPELIHALPPAPEADPIPLEIDGPVRLRDSQIAMLDKEKCRRRFFYTHVLGVGGRRTETDYMRMHEAARSVVRAIVRDGLDVSDDARLTAAVELACDDHGLEGPGAFAELRAAAVALVAAFVRTRGPYTPRMPETLILRFTEDEVRYGPDDVLADSQGNLIHRRVRTGVFRKADTEDLSVAATLLAIADNTPGATAEVVHLTGGIVSPLSMTPLVLGRRREALQVAIGRVRAGEFPTNPTQRVCPRCPAFFVCGTVPAGILKKEF